MGFLKDLLKKCFKRQENNSVEDFKVNRGVT